MMSDLKLATRGSRLAMTQANRVAGMLRDTHPGLEVEIAEVTTTGDRDPVTSVAMLTEIGAFVRSVQEAVLRGDADLAVHSCKDLPVAGPEGLVAFYPEREAPWDALCGHDLASLPEGARVGTGSPRRSAQMRLLRPDVDIADIRGNVETRLGKLETGGYDAVILAEAGLNRLGLDHAIGHRFGGNEMVPAPAQAALAVEVGKGTDAEQLVQAIDDPRVRAAVEAERILLARTGAGCRSALGALAREDGADISIVGFVEDGDGPRFGAARGDTPQAAARNLQGELGL